MNYINYFKHILYTPDTVHRRTDFDLPEVEKGKEIPQWQEVSSLALPFICLYRPAGHSISIGMGGLRLFSTLQGALSSEKGRGWKKYSTDLVKVSLAISSLSATLFHFQIGSYVTSGADLLQGLERLIQHLNDGNREKATQELLQILSTSLYLAFMTKGALEMLLLFSLSQGLLSLLQSKEAFLSEKPKYLEGVAKLAMACVRGYQAKGYLHQVQRRDALLAIEKYQALFAKASKGRAVRELLEHPLQELEAETDKHRVILSDGKKEYDLGARFHGMGKDLVKGDNLTFKTVSLEGKEQLELTFKVNHVHREELSKSLQDLTCLSSKERSEVLKFAGSHATTIRISEEPLRIGETPFDVDSWWMDENKQATVVQLDGLGCISFLEDPTYPNLYNRIVIRMDLGKNLYDLHEIASFLDLENVLGLSTQEDLERIKIGHLFRTFFPKEATPFERSSEFFSLSLEELKDTIIEKAPAMTGYFERFLTLMRPYEILPGQVRYLIPGLGDLAYEKGARGIISAITGSYWDDQDLFSRVSSILQMGLLSTQTRAEAGVHKNGLGGSADWLTGGADSVYTQMLTEQHCREGFDLNELYHGRIRILFSLKTLDTGSYQYLDDAFGNRLYQSQHWFSYFLSSYAERPDILTLTEELQKTPTDPYGMWEYDRHEIMFKERLAPSFIEALIIEDQETRDALVDYLRLQNLIETNPTTGEELLLGKRLDSFLRVGTTVSEELLTGAGP